MASASGKSQINSEMEDEDDEMLYFKFNDDAVQPYMSLGLTPLSQLSPDHVTPSNASDSYYFPSMPPPVNPISSVFSVNKSSPIPMDSQFNISGGEMMIPEDHQIYDHSSGNTTSSKSRKTKYEVPVHSQGYTTKLEPVPEHSPSLDDSYSKPLAIGSSMSSNSTDNTSSFLFPSADVHSDYPVHNHLQRRMGKRLKSGIRRKSEDHLNVQHKTVSKNHLFVDSNEVKLGHENNHLKPSGSPSHEGKIIHQQMKEKAHLLNRTQGTATIAQNYGSTKRQDQDSRKHTTTSHRSIRKRDGLYSGTAGNTPLQATEA